MLTAGHEQQAILTSRLAAILLPCYLLSEIVALLEFLQSVGLASEPKVRPSQVCLLKFLSI